MAGWLNRKAPGLSVVSMSLPVTDLNQLEGRIVLVCSARDRHNPPTGMRDTLRVVPDAEKTPSHVEIELEFPQMFSTRAHHRTVRLSEEKLAELLASERDGTFSVTLDDRLDPAAPQENE